MDRFQRERLIEAVEVYKQIGLFKDQKPHEVVDEYIKTSLGLDYPEVFHHEIDAELADQDDPVSTVDFIALLHQSKNGVWFAQHKWDPVHPKSPVWHHDETHPAYIPPADPDTYSLFCPNFRTYAKMIREWEALSDGALRLTAVSEIAEADLAPVTFEVTANGKTWRYQQKQWMARYIDWGVLFLLNNVLEEQSSERLFVLVEDDINAPVLFLTKQEREVLVENLSLTFW